MTNIYNIESINDMRHILSIDSIEAKNAKEAFITYCNIHKYKVRDSSNKYYVPLDNNNIHLNVTIKFSYEVIYELDNFIFNEFGTYLFTTLRIKI